MNAVWTAPTIRFGRLGGWRISAAMAWPAAGIVGKRLPYRLPDVTAAE